MECEVFAMTLGDRLRQIRESKGLTQIFVSKKLGIANTTLSSYENDERKPDPDTLKKLADFYDVSTDWLLGRTDVLEMSKQLGHKEVAILKELKDVPEEYWDEIRTYINFLKFTRGKRTRKKEKEADML
jgi:transcriptional regulator with XRE-family HTH domain